MMEWIFQIGLSNICIAALLTIIAFAVGAKSRRPHLVHLLWLLVLLKLVTPPVFQIPYQALLSEPAEAVAATRTLVATGFEAGPVEDPVGVTMPWQAWFASLWAQAKVPFAVVWLVGSLVVLFLSGIRVWKFNRLLRGCSSPPGSKVEQMVLDMAAKFDCRPPIAVIAKANIAPLVWWVGGNVRLVLPESLVATLQPDQLRLVIAHEMAHVSRRDYLVRWLEWFACVLFWCVPIAWWAQRNLRKAEEVCCDAMVLSRVQPDLGNYANSILTAVESLVCPAIRPPAIASEINSGGFLKRRIEMIISNDNELRWRPAQLLLVALATLLIPMGMLGAQDNDVVQRRLTKMVKQGHLTKKQAAIMLSSLNKKNADRVVPVEVAEEPSANIQWREKAKSDWKDAQDDFAKIEAKLKKAIVAGKISKSDAKKKMAAYKESMAKKWRKDAILWKTADKMNKKADLKSLYTEKLKDIILARVLLDKQKAEGTVVEGKANEDVELQLYWDESRQHGDGDKNTFTFEVDDEYQELKESTERVVEGWAVDAKSNKFLFKKKPESEIDSIVELRWIPNPDEVEDIVELQSEDGDRIRLLVELKGAADEQEVEEVIVELDSPKEVKEKKKGKTKTVKGKRK